jgi:hypothetical protein
MFLGLRDSCRHKLFGARLPRLRANGRLLHFSFREQLDAFGRFLKTFFRSLNPRAERAPFPDAKLANIGGVIIPALGRRWRAPRTPPK